MARNPKKFIHGKISPKDLLHPEKYICKRPINGEAIIEYRSSWERFFINYLDRNNNVIQWGSEEIEIRYILSTTGQTHRYFPDFWMKVRVADGTVKEFVVEIKPMKEVMEPQYVITAGMNENTKKEIIETYVKNQDKWRAAESYCKSHGMGFKKLTEQDILYVKRHMRAMDRNGQGSGSIGNNPAVPSVPDPAESVVNPKDLEESGNELEDIKEELETRTDDPLDDIVEAKDDISVQQPVVESKEVPKEEVKPDVMDGIMSVPVKKQRKKASQKVKKVRKGKTHK